MIRITPLVAATALTLCWATAAHAAEPANDSRTVLGTSVAAAAAQKGPNSSQCRKDPGLFDRLGGFFGIALVVNNFSDAILENDVLNANQALADWNVQEAPTDLPGLKFLRTMWIAAMVGGPIKYTGQPLASAHDRFDLTPEQFAEVGSEIVKALQAANIAPADIELAVCIYQTSMNDVVSSSTAMEPRKPPKQ